MGPHVEGGHLPSRNEFVACAFCQGHKAGKWTGEEVEEVAVTEHHNLHCDAHFSQSSLDPWRDGHDSQPQARKPRLREAHLLVQSYSESSWAQIWMMMPWPTILTAWFPIGQTLPSQFQTCPVGNIPNSFCLFLSPKDPQIPQAELKSELHSVPCCIFQPQAPSEGSW